MPSRSAISALVDGNVKNVFDWLPPFDYDQEKPKVARKDLIWGSKMYSSNNRYFGQMDPTTEAKIGKGILIYSNGSLYEGWFKDGKRCGQGRFICKTFAYYEGEFRDDRINGHGRQCFPDGSMFVGKFVDELACGPGTLFQSDGIQYEGDWKFDKRHGAGF